MMSLAKLPALIVLAATTIFVVASGLGIAEGFADSKEGSDSSAPWTLVAALGDNSSPSHNLLAATPASSAQAESPFEDTPLASDAEDDDPFGGPSAPVKASSKKKDGPKFYDNKQRTGAELAIELALQKTVPSLDFDELPLNELTQFLEELYDIRVVIDTSALDEFGLTKSEPCTFSISGIRFESALDLLLSSMDLTYIVRNETLFITTREGSDEYQETRVYRLPPSLEGYESEIIEAIKSTVEPTEWDEVGGIGSITQVLNGLVIRTSYHNHKSINRLLEQLERLETAP